MLPYTAPLFAGASCWPLGNTQPSLCPVSVCVHSPVAAFHILVVLLQELASTEEPSAENATKNTRPRCLESIRVHSPVMAFHTLAVLRISHTPLALRNHLEKILPSVQIDAHRLPEPSSCPENVSVHTPHAAFHTLAVRSCEDVSTKEPCRENTAWRWRLKFAQSLSQIS